MIHSSRAVSDKIAELRNFTFDEIAGVILDLEIQLEECGGKLDDAIDRMPKHYVHADDMVEVKIPEYGQGYFCTAAPSRGLLYEPPRLRTDLHAHAQPTMMEIAASLAEASARFAAMEAEHAAHRDEINAMFDRHHARKLAYRDTNEALETMALEGLV